MQLSVSLCLIPPAIKWLPLSLFSHVPGIRWHLSVLATRLRLYRCAVSQDERSNAAAQLPYGSGETKGEGMPLHFTCRLKIDSLIGSVGFVE